MRVLLSVYAMSPCRGGEPGNSWKLAVALADRGVDVDVLCTPLAASDAEMVGSMPEHLRVLPVGSHVPPVDPSNVLAEYWHYVRWQRQSLRVAREAMAHHRYDVVHHYSWGSLLWGSPLARLGLPMLFGPVSGGVTVHPALRPALSWRARVTERVRGLVVTAVRFDPLARSTVRRVCTVPNDSATRGLVERMGGVVDPVFRLQDTIAPEWFERDILPLADRRPRSVLWVARFIERKGPSLALRAVALMPPDVRVTMVGDGPELARCKELAVDLGVSDRIEFTGRVSHERFRELAAEHSVFLFSPIRDTFGGQLVEAASQGTPVVAIRQHGVRDHLSDACGVLVEPGDPASTAGALAQGVVDLLGDDERWANASGAARERAAGFLLERVVESTLESYERVVSGSSAA